MKGNYFTPQDQFPSREEREVDEIIKLRRIIWILAFGLCLSLVWQMQEKSCSDRESTKELGEGEGSGETQSEPASLPFPPVASDHMRLNLPLKVSFLNFERGGRSRPIKKLKVALVNQKGHFIVEQAFLFLEEEKRRDLSYETSPFFENGLENIGPSEEESKESSLQAYRVVDIPQKDLPTLLGSLPDFPLWVLPVEGLEKNSSKKEKTFSRKKTENEYEIKF